MSYHLKVKGLAGLHIGKRVTVKTKHTQASGVLQGFEHATDTINDSGFGSESWALGQTRTTITLLPDQRIVATMEDEIVMHGYDKPDPESTQHQSIALKIINDNPEAFHGPGD